MKKVDNFSWKECWKEVVQLNFKGSQRQYELNAKVDAMLDWNR